MRSSRSNRLAGPENRRTTPRRLVSSASATIFAGEFGFRRHRVRVLDYSWRLARTRAWGPTAHNTSGFLVAPAPARVARVEHVRIGRIALACDVDSISLHVEAVLTFERVEVIQPVKDAGRICMGRPPGQVLITAGHRRTARRSLYLTCESGASTYPQQSGCTGGDRKELPSSPHLDSPLVVVDLVDAIGA
jgi:hypothetical protein